jgi:hypothetical protein
MPPPLYLRRRFPQFLAVSGSGASASAVEHQLISLNFP